MNKPGRVPGCRGFTLLELVIVLVIMGVVLAFVGPRVAKSLTGITLKTNARKIAALLRYARSQAVNTGTVYHVVFDTGHKRVVVMQSLPRPDTSMTAADAAAVDGAADETAEDAMPPKPPLPETKVLLIPEEIEFKDVIIGGSASGLEEQEGIRQLSFSPSGSSQGGEILLADEKERVFRILVDLLTGTVSVAEAEED